MPKSKIGAKKRKNPGVGVDFRRVRQKVGRKLQPAQNATDTTVRSRTITLPGQSLAEDRTGAAVTRRNLTLKELLGKVGHYSDAVRRETLAGLQELLTANPLELKRHLGPILAALAPRLADPDDAARAALRGLLTTTVLGGGAEGAKGAEGASAGAKAGAEAWVGAGAGACLAPHVPLLTAHVGAALTHLEPRIRRDAAAVLEALVAAAPAQLGGRGALEGTALRHYAGLLAPGQRSRTVRARSLEELHQVLQSLRQLLERARPETSTACQPSGCNPAAEERSLGGAWLHAARCRHPPRAACGGGASIAELREELLAAAGSGQAASGGAPEAAEQLLGRLLEAWAECAPSQLATAPQLLAVQVMGAVVACANLLVERGEAQGQSLAPGVERAVAALLARVAPHIPVAAPVVRPSAALQVALVELNLSAAQLLTRFLPRASQPTQHAPQADPGAVARLLGFCEGVLHRDAFLPPDPRSLGATAPQGKERRTSAPAAASGGALYAPVLQAVAAALPLAAPEQRASLLQALTACAARLPARGPARAACLATQVELLDRRCPASGPPLVDEHTAAMWIEAMPKLVWELGTADPEASLQALRLLHIAARSVPPGGPLSTAFEALQPQLCPLFPFVAPLGVGANSLNRTGAPRAKGSGKGDPPGAKGAAVAGPQGGAVRVQPGPLAKLPLACQVLAADLLSFFGAPTPPLLRALSLACLTPHLPAEVACRALRGVARGVAGSAAPPGGFAPTLLGIVVGRSSAVGEGEVASDPERRRAVLEAAAQAALTTEQRPGEALRALEHSPMLESCLGSHLACSGLLTYAARLLAAGRGGALLADYPGPERVLAHTHSVALAAEGEKGQLQHQQWQRQGLLSEGLRVSLAGVAVSCVLSGSDHAPVLAFLGGADGCVALFLAGLAAALGSPPRAKASRGSAKAPRDQAARSEPAVSREGLGRRACAALESLTRAMSPAVRAQCGRDAEVLLQRLRRTEEAVV